MSDLTLEVLMEAKKKLDSICNKVPAYARVPAYSYSMNRPSKLWWSEAFDPESWPVFPGGLTMIPSEHMRYFVQAKTHRKKRINKKYRKKYGFTEVPWNFVYMTEDAIIAHPLTIEWMKNRMEIDESNVL